MILNCFKMLGLQLETISIVVAKRMFTTMEAVTLVTQDASNYQIWKRQLEDELTILGL